VKKVLMFSVGTLLVLMFCMSIFSEFPGEAQQLSVHSVNQPVTVLPSLALLGGGAKWAAGNGTNVLFVDWEDNYLAHGSTNGVDWGPWPAEADMINWTLSVGYILNSTGLNVSFASDIPDNLTGYDLVVIHAYWAVEPRHCQLVKGYIGNGGGVVVLSGVPEFFRCYCKDWWTYKCPTDPASVGMDEWLGCDGNYFNTGGNAYVTVYNPFSTLLKIGDPLFASTGHSNAGIMGPHEGSTVIATWADNVTFAYTYTYGQGRIYYQASYDCLVTGAPPSPPPPPPPPPATSAVLCIDPSNVSNVAVGSTFKVVVNVRNVTDLFTWQILVQFNASELNCVQAIYPSSGYIFSGEPQIPIAPIIDNVSGAIRFGASLLGSGSASGNGGLCEITFKVMALGESSIDFSQPYGAQTFLLNGNIEIIPAMLQNSSFSNDPPIGDVTGANGVPDGIVDMRDVGLVARKFGELLPPASPILDLNHDGKIDMHDLATVVRNFRI